jgi:hypothetical protein
MAAEPHSTTNSLQGDKVTKPKWHLAEPVTFAQGHPSFLCTVCRHINFHYMLYEVPHLGVPERNEVPLGSVERLRSTQQCAFCQLIKETLDNVFQPIQLPTKHEGKEVRLSMISLSETMNKSHPRQLMIWLKPNPFADAGTPPLQIQLVQDADKIFENNGLGRSINHNKLDFILALYWIRSCRMGYGIHKETNPSPVRQPPPNFRLIDLQRKCVVPINKPTDYVTLSYVWPPPEDDILKLETSNCKPDGRGLINNDEALSNPAKGFEEKIPQTIKDAMLLAKTLGERYLWVDALCIIQNDPIDVVKQIQAMDFIYSSSALTIASTCGENAHAAIPGVRFGNRGILQTTKIIQGFQLANRPWTFEKAVKSSVWNARAWTYQERLLSKRTLFVTPQQMFFKCCHSESYLMEDLDVSATPRRQVTHPMDDTASDIIPYHGSINTLTYQKVVEYFTTRNLRYKHDILNAFSGIARYMQPIFRSEFLYGLPQSELDYCLMWEPVGKIERRVCDNGAEFPSWSWAGWVGAIHYRWDERLSRLKWLDEVGHKLSLDQYRLSNPSMPQADQEAWKQQWTEKRVSWGFRYFHHPSDSTSWFRNPVAEGPRLGPNCIPGTQLLRIEAEVIDIKMPTDWSPEMTETAAGPIWEFSLDDNGFKTGYFRVPTNVAKEMHHSKSYKFVRIARCSIHLDRESIRSLKNGDRPAWSSDTPLDSDTAFDELDGDPDISMKPGSFPDLPTAEDASHWVPFDRRRYDPFKPFPLNEFLVVQMIDDIAYRIGVGRIHVDAWAQEPPKTEIVTLG